MFDVVLFEIDSRSCEKNDDFNCR